MGERLHEYDIDLTDYAVGNVVQYLTDPRFARRVARHIKTPALIDHLRARSDSNVDAPQVRTLFSDAEMELLSLAFEDGPPGGPWNWQPYAELHRRHMQTIGEVKDGLSRQVAEEWSADCARFAGELETDGLSLHDGLVVIRKWVQRLRELQLAMGAEQFVPAADVPTALVQPPLPAAPATSDAASEHASKLVVNMQRMRVAIKELGAEAKSKTLIRHAGIRDQDGGRALRSLAELDEYKGYSRPPLYKPTGE